MTPYDEEVVLRRLQHLARTVERLEVDLPETLDDLLADPDGLVMAAVQHRLVVAAQAVADTAAHIVVSQGFGPPDTYAAAIGALAGEGILPPELAERLSRAVGLRNVLVHLYLDMEPGRVVEAVRGRDDFRRFISYLSEWLDDT